MNIHDVGVVVTYDDVYFLIIGMTVCTHSSYKLVSTDHTQGVCTANRRHQDCVCGRPTSWTRPAQQATPTRAHLKIFIRRLRRRRRQQQHQRRCRPTFSATSARPAWPATLKNVLH